VTIFPFATVVKLPGFTKIT